MVTVKYSFNTTENVPWNMSEKQLQDTPDTLFAKYSVSSPHKKRLSTLVKSFKFKKTHVEIASAVTQERTEASITGT